MVSLSLLSMDQPLGRLRLNPSLVSSPVCVVVVGEATGLGDKPGVGLGMTSTIPPLDGACDARLPRRANPAPTPAMTTVRIRTPAMISVHGVRWTGTGAPAGA